MSIINCRSSYYLDGVDNCRSRKSAHFSIRNSMLLERDSCWRLGNEVTLKTYSNSFFFRPTAVWTNTDATQESTARANNGASKQRREQPAVRPKHDVEFPFLALHNVPQLPTPVLSYNQACNVFFLIFRPIWNTPPQLSYTQVLAFKFGLPHSHLVPCMSELVWGAVLTPSM